MKKLNKKGFFLSEALIVGVVVTAVITVLYVGIINILNSYNKRAYYNNVSSLYTLDNIRSLMYDKGISYFVEKLGSDRYYLVTCDDFANPTSPGIEELCKYVYNFGSNEQPVGSTVVDKVLFTRYDISNLKGFSDDVITEGTTTDYIDALPIVADTNDYRLILILKERPDGTTPEAKLDLTSKHWYTTLKVVGE